MMAPSMVAATVVDESPDIDLVRGAIKGVMRRMPDFRVADDFEPHYQVGEARAMVSLPATFAPSKG